MLEIYVDADACPVKEEVVRVAARHELPIHMVSNQWMRLPDNPLVRRVVVEQGLDNADDWIVEHIGPGDIAVTADIPLASRCLEKGAKALGPTGKPFNTDNIASALAIRELNSHLRETGMLKGGGQGFGKQDRSRFLCAMEDAIQAVKRGK